jgi:hypothetical protein
MKKKIKRMLSIWDIKSEKKWASMGVLPCSLNEAKTRPDLAGVDFAKIEASMMDAINAQFDLARYLGLPVETDARLVRAIAYNSMRFGHLMTRF